MVWTDPLDPCYEIKIINIQIGKCKKREGTDYMDLFVNNQTNFNYGISFPCLRKPAEFLKDNLDWESGIQGK
jgi:hypothetical protein